MWPTASQITGGAKEPAFRCLYSIVENMEGGSIMNECVTRNRAARITTLLAAIAVVMMAVVLPLHAQWILDGVPISIAPEGQCQHQITSDGMGGAIIVWQDERDKLSTGADIYAQRVDANGYVLWITDGVPICTMPGDQLVPVIAPDGAGGAIIAWVDVRHGDYYENDIYAQRIDASGNILWMPDGVPVCIEPGEQVWPQIVSDEMGGAIICWWDDHGIFAQRLDPSGYQYWPPQGRPICTGDAGWAHMTADGFHGAIIAWIDGRGADDDIYAQRITESGSIPWYPNGVPVCTAPGDQFDWRGPMLTADGTGGAYIVWADERVGDTWVEINTGLGSPYVFAFSLFPSYIVAGTHHGVYRSGDEGNTWEWANNGIGVPDVRAFGLAFSYYFAGTYGGGMYRTLDEGDSWEPCSNGLGNMFVTSIAYDSMNDVIFAGTRAAGVYRSHNGGDNWEWANGGLHDLEINTLYYKNGYLFAGTAHQGAFRSTDYGGSWMQVNNGLGYHDVSSFVYAFHTGSLFAGTKGGGIYRSNDWGNSWMPVNTGLGHPDVRALAYDYYRRHLFAGTFGDGVYRSTNNGDTWTAVNAGLGHSQINALLHKKYNTIYAGTYGGGIYRYSQNRDIYCQRITEHGHPVASPDGVPICTAPGNQWNTDIVGGGGAGGAVITWEDERMGFGETDIYAQRVDMMCNPIWMAAGVPVCLGGGGQYSPRITGGGGSGGSIITWVDTRVGEGDIYAQRVDYGGAISWIPDGVPVCSAPGYQNEPRITTDMAGGAIIAWKVGDIGGGPISTFDIYAQRITEAGEFPIATLLQSFSAAGDETGITISWRLIETGTDMRFYVLRTEKSADMFVEIPTPQIISDGPVFSFRDERCERGIAYRYRIDVEDEDGRRTLFKTEPVILAPLSFMLHQNHPNPFNPSTAISFAIPETGAVSLRIYDASGRLVRVLVDERRDAGRYHEVWDGYDVAGSRVASGIYFYSLAAGKAKMTRKMVLLK